MKPQLPQSPHSDPSFKGGSSVRGGVLSSDSWPMDHSPSTRSHGDLDRGSQASCPVDGPGDDNPFEHALDDEDEWGATARSAAASSVVLPAGTPAPSQEALVSQTIIPRLQDSLLQCPFCQSVFRSTVAGQLGLCPVCAAVAQDPGNSASTAVAAVPARLNRSGTPPALKVNRSYKRVEKGGRQHVSGSTQPASKRGRWVRLLVMVGVGLLACWAIAALAGLVFSNDLTFDQRKPTEICSGVPDHFSGGAGGEMIFLSLPATPKFNSMAHDKMIERGIQLA